MPGMGGMGGMGGAGGMDFAKMMQGSESPFSILSSLPFLPSSD